MAETRSSAWRAALASVLRSSACPSSLEPSGESRELVFSSVKNWKDKFLFWEREVDVGHLLVPLQAGQGRGALAVGCSSRPASSQVIKWFGKLSILAAYMARASARIFLSSTL